MKAGKKQEFEEAFDSKKLFIPQIVGDGRFQGLSLMNITVKGEWWS